jgi:hypothetical protein
LSAGQLGDGLLTLINEGTIDATGAHALVIDTGANVVLNSGTLMLDHSLDFSGGVSGLKTGEQIDLIDINFGQYAAEDFHVASDSATGTQFKPDQCANFFAHAGYGLD